MKRFWAYLICVIAIVLPYRLRIFFAAGLGWLDQAAYLLYFSTMRLLVKNLRKKNGRE